MGMHLTTAAANCSQQESCSALIGRHPALPSEECQLQGLNA